MQVPILFVGTRRTILSINPFMHNISYKQKNCGQRVNKRTAIQILSALLVFTITAGAQTKQGIDTRKATVTATATVISTTVELLAIKDMELELYEFLGEDIEINPVSDTRAAVMKIVGGPKTTVRVTFDPNGVLRHETENSKMLFSYRMSGNTEQVQNGSQMLRATNQVTLGATGEYYLWLGGILSVTDQLYPGNYDLEFTIEMEYI